MMHESEFSVFRNPLNSFFSKYDNPRHRNVWKSVTSHGWHCDWLGCFMYIYIYEV